MRQSCQSIFPSLSDHAQLWVVPLEGTPVAFARLLHQIRLTLESWTSHGRAVQSSTTVLFNRFLLIAGEIPGSTVSGCGIDSLMHSVEEASTHSNCRMLSPMLMYYLREKESVAIAPRGQFRRMIAEGKISSTTRVFNPGVHTLRELRTNKFELPLSESVYAQIFQIPVATA